MRHALDDLIFAHRLATVRLSATSTIEWTADQWFDAPRDTAAKLERFLGPALGDPGGGNLNNLINTIPVAGDFDSGDRDALHWIRQRANEGKHGTVTCTFDQIWAGMERALTALVHLRGALPQPVQPGLPPNVRIAICELDYPQGGETEWIAFFVSPSGALSAQVDGCQLEFNDRDTLIGFLNASGKVSQPCTWVGEEATDRWKTSSGFIQFIGFEGRYLDFAEAIAAGQHSLALLKGLARDAYRWRGVAVGLAAALAHRIAAGKTSSLSANDVDRLAITLGIREKAGLATLANGIHALLTQAPAPLHGFSLDVDPRIVSTKNFEAFADQRDIALSGQLGIAVTPEGAIVVAV